MRMLKNEAARVENILTVRQLCAVALLQDGHRFNSHQEPSVSLGSQSGTGG